MEKPLRSYYNRYNLFWSAIIAIAFTEIIVVLTNSGVSIWHLVFAVLVWLVIPAIKAHDDLVNAYEAQIKEANQDLDKSEQE